jgi:hypothetical protein
MSIWNVRSGAIGHVHVPAEQVSGSISALEHLTDRRREQKALAWDKAYKAMRAKYTVLLPALPGGYSMGFVIATGGLHAAGIGIGTVHRWSWGQTVLRLGGGVVALGGVFFMWKALA